MQFNIHLGSAHLDIANLEHRLQQIDPAGLADFDALSRVLRISANLSKREALVLMADSGHLLTPDRVEIEPSVCCGGCGG